MAEHLANADPDVAGFGVVVVASVDRVFDDAEFAANTDSFDPERYTETQTRVRDAISHFLHLRIKTLGVEGGESCAAASVTAGFPAATGNRGEWNDLVGALNRAAVFTDGRVLVLVDDNFYYRSMRRSYYMMCRRFGCSYAQLFLDTPVSESLRRNAARPVPVAEHLVRGMAAKFEPPSEPWERERTVRLGPSLSNGKGKYIADPNVTLVLAALRDIQKDAPVPWTVEEERETVASVRATLESEKHQVDVETRRMLSRYVGGHRDRLTGTQIQQLNRRRRAFLENGSAVEFEAFLNTFFENNR